MMFNFNPYELVKDWDNLDRVLEIIHRPEFQTDNMLPNTLKERESGLKELLDMGETEIYKRFKEK